jgi:carbamoyl-phosphate synthase large subunit
VKRVFVSGGAGVIGHVLVSKLLAQGLTVFVGDLKPCPSDWQNGVYYRQGDLNTLTAAEIEHFQPDTFFHLAATFERSEESFPFLEENFHHNVKLSHHLLQCLKNCKTLQRIVFASSYLIYDPQLYQFVTPPKTPTILKEDMLMDPRNLCGMAKLLHERELLFFNHFSSAVTTVSARIFVCMAADRAM